MNSNTLPTWRAAALSDGATAGLEARLEETARRAQRYFESARVPATVRAYASDLADFETWHKTEAGGLSTLPATADIPTNFALRVRDQDRRSPPVFGPSVEA